MLQVPELRRDVRLFLTSRRLASFWAACRSIYQNPEFVQARLFRGFTFAQVKAYDAAIEDFTYILNHVDEYNKKKILPLAKTYESAADPANAFTYYSLFIQKAAQRDTVIIQQAKAKLENLKAK